VDQRGQPVGNYHKGPSGQNHYSDSVGDYLSTKLKANGVLVLQITFDHVKRLEDCHFIIAIHLTAF
jgi:hypothetical protein